MITGDRLKEIIGATRFDVRNESEPGKYQPSMSAGEAYASITALLAQSRSDGARELAEKLIAEMPGTWGWDEMYAIEEYVNATLAQLNPEGGE